MSLAAAVADEVQRRMTAAGLSAREVARRAELPPTLMHRAMRRERDLSIDELAAVATVLRLTPEHLVRVARTRIPQTGDPTRGASDSTQG